jgi:hypothetical protein
VLTGAPFAMVSGHQYVRPVCNYFRTLTGATRSRVVTQ